VNDKKKGNSSRVVGNGRHLPAHSQGWSLGTREETFRHAVYAPQGQPPIGRQFIACFQDTEP
ncbi:MAG: hypothetical protein AABY74_10045, partial [Planctomycetota bacterium]